MVAVSPFVAGRAVKGPTEAFCRQAGWALGAAGIATAYAGVIDGIVSDEHELGLELPALSIPTLMSTPAERRALAEQTLGFAASLHL